MEWNRHSYKSSVQTASGQDFNRAIGGFTLSQFVPESPNVITLTSEGNILVWTSPSQEGPQVKMKRVLKLYQHSEGVALTCVQSLCQYLVLGNARGEVSFLDRDLKLTQWKERVATGPINSISFAVSVSERKLHKHLLPKETTIQQSKFSVPNFMAGMFLHTNRRAVATWTLIFNIYSRTSLVLLYDSTNTNNTKFRLMRTLFQSPSKSLQYK